MIACRKKCVQSDCNALTHREEMLLLSRIQPLRKSQRNPNQSPCLQRKVNSCVVLSYDVDYAQVIGQQLRRLCPMHKHAMPYTSFLSAIHSLINRMLLLECKGIPFSNTILFCIKRDTFPNQSHASS